MLKVVDEIVAKSYEKFINSFRFIIRQVKYFHSLRDLKFNEDLVYFPVTGFGGFSPFNNSKHAAVSVHVHSEP